MLSEYASGLDFAELRAVPCPSDYTGTAIALHVAVRRSCIDERTFDIAAECNMNNPEEQEACKRYFANHTVLVALMSPACSQEWRGMTPVPTPYGRMCGGNSPSTTAERSRVYGRSTSVYHVVPGRSMDRSGEMEKNIPPAMGSVPDGTLGKSAVGMDNITSISGNSLS